MSDTTHLELPLIAASQSQKHVTHNEALVLLDAVVQLSVKDRDLTAPPMSPVEGDRYIVASGATGAWSTWGLNIAVYIDGAWRKLVPREGWIAWVQDEDRVVIYNGASWTDPTLHAMTGLRPAMLLPAPPADIWRSDISTPAGTPRTYTIAAVSGSAVTITANEVEQFFNAGMRNASMVRIWNTTKAPAQAAWVNWNSAPNQFNVHNAADVASWLPGETLRLGDPNPTGANVLNMVAIDISNYLYNNFGSVFPQRGLKLNNQVQGVGGRVSMECSGTGAGGTAVGSSSNSDGSRQSSFPDVFTTTLSPISNSNLLFLRETIIAPATALDGSRLMRLAGVWV